MLKTFVDVYDAIDYLYYPTKIFGMAPYTRKIDKNNRFEYAVCPFGFQHVIINGGMAGLIVITSVCRILSELTSHTVSFVDGVDGALYIFMQLVTLSTISAFIVKQRDFLLSAEMLEKADKILKARGANVSYKILQRILIALILLYPFYLFIVVSPLWEFVYISQTQEFFSYKSKNFILQWLNLAPTYIIRHTPVLFYCGFLLLIHERFQFLNGYLLKVESIAPDKFTDVIDTLSVVENLHNYLYHSTKHISETFSMAIFFNVSMTFLELVAAIVILQYSINVESFQAVCGMVLYGAIVLFILTVCEMVKSEANKTKRLLCELTLPFFNAELTKKRNMLLLQVLHEEVVFDACGFYILDVTVITSHVGTMSTLLMFFLQLRNVLLSK